MTTDDTMDDWEVRSAQIDEALRELKKKLEDQSSRDTDRALARFAASSPPEDASRVHGLERRIEELEHRVEDLERRWV